MTIYLMLVAQGLAVYMTGKILVYMVLGKEHLLHRTGIR